ncbi:hypothetical protein BE08_37390 [Sorangium cellulosum]|uniref:Uncharacterized protein n=1 Tax=Sorangium cellulosum TaxID=56 RepID=A0A150PBL0_SORCE|nr:hypothetical protein BE08_37390 [Sorangium cellulosum]
MDLDRRAVLMMLESEEMSCSESPIGSASPLGRAGGKASLLTNASSPHAERVRRLLRSAPSGGAAWNDALA